MPACFRILRSRSWRISPSCGFGIVTVKTPLIIYGCLPSWCGPSKPHFLIRSTKVRQETGESLGIIPYSKCVTWNFEIRYWQIATKSENNPSFQSARKIFTAIFLCFSDGPDPTQFFYFSIKSLPFVNKFISSLV